MEPKEKAFRGYIEKIKWGQAATMPMCQGMAIKAVIKEYKIPAKLWGYWFDVIGVQTNKQTILWRDIGTGVQFLGLLNKDTDKVELSKPDERVEHKMFKTYEELRAEVRKRDYQDIKGLKAKITEEDYDNFLNVLPPLGWKKNTFYLSEFLSGDLTYNFSRVGKQCYCDVADFREEQPELQEKIEAGVVY